MNEDQRTLFCGNLSDKVSEEILFELFLQAGPLEKVRIPKDKDGRQRSFAFVIFKHECSVPYATSLFEGTALFNRVLHLKSRQAPNDQRAGNNVAHHRAYSAPVSSNTHSYGTPDFQHLLQLGQQLLIPGNQLDMIQDVQRSNNTYDNYCSTSQYLGTPISLNSLRGNWTRGNQPHNMQGSGQKRKNSDRDKNYRRGRRNNERRGFERY